MREIRRQSPVRRRQSPPKTSGDVTTGRELLAGGEGADRLQGGSGSDTADYSDSAARVIVNTGWHRLDEAVRPRVQLLIKIS